MPYLTASKIAEIKERNPIREGHQATVEEILEEVAAAIAAGTVASEAANVAAIGASTNITAVPGSFADLAAVQTYLAGANMVPNIEARLDALETKVNAILTGMKAADLMVAD